MPNSCPCGWYGDQDANRCRCASAAIARYQTRISGPLKDRFDIHLWVKAVDPEVLMHQAAVPPFTAAEMNRARKAQTERATALRLSSPWNARLKAAHLPDAAEPSPAALTQLVEAARRTHLTGRGVHRTLRVARTIADLAGSLLVEPDHIHDAMSYRS